MTEPNTKPKKPSRAARNSAARLLAVQALYQYQKNKDTPRALIREYLDHRSGMTLDEETYVPAEESHFITLVEGVAEHQDQLQTILQAHRKGAKPVNEPLLLAIFLCGLYELQMMGSIDTPIIVSDYVNVAKAFYEGGEPKMVNAVLDAAAKTLRP